jgi:threonine dehydratase
MVGGQAWGVSNEALIRFEFPERPGALLDFLSGLGRRWNISLFHYRNQGAAYGRVLMGIQVPPGEHAEFRQLIDRLGYCYWLETDNPAYRIFTAARTPNG